MKIGRILVVVFCVCVIVGFRADPVAAPHYSSWSAPVHLPAPINSSFTEPAATLSNDELSHYLTSTRACGAGDILLDANIWVAHRSSIDAQWTDPECLEINLDGFEDSNPSFSRDGHWMFFVNNRPGSLGATGTSPGRDIWATWRAHVHDDHAWGEPVNAGLVNSEVADAGPTYFENEGALPQLFFTSRRTGVFDLWVNDVLGDFQFSTPRSVPELNTPDAVEAGPSIRHDGLEIFFFRGLTTFDIFTATRSDHAEPWSTPMRVDEPISSEFNEQAPRLSKDGQALLFSSTRTGTLGNLDIWMTTREKTRGKP